MRYRGRAGVVLRETAWRRRAGEAVGMSLQRVGMGRGVQGAHRSSAHDPVDGVEGRGKVDVLQPTHRTRSDASCLADLHFAEHGPASLVDGKQSVVVGCGERQLGEETEASTRILDVAGRSLRTSSVRLRLCWLFILRVDTVCCAARRTLATASTTEHFGRGAMGRAATLWTGAGLVGHVVNKHGLLPGLCRRRCTLPTRTQPYNWVCPPYLDECAHCALLDIAAPTSAEENLRCCAKDGIRLL